MALGSRELNRIEAPKLGQGEYKGSSLEQGETKFIYHISKVL